MKENKLAEKIINKIKNEGVKPISRWKFVMKDSLFWGAFMASILIGGMAVSIILNTLLNNDWDLYMQLSGGLSKFIVITLPYFWLILLGIFVVIAYLNIQNTKKAYKHSFKVIIGGVILMSFLLGLTFYNLGLASSFDKRFIQKLPSRVHQIADPRLGVWQKPEEGFLVGEIQEFDENNLSIVDFEGNLWEISLTSELKEYLFPILLQSNIKKIRVMGQLNLEQCHNCFCASVIRPLSPQRGMMINQLNKIPKGELQGMMKRKEI
ncbi:MAG: hypothetical protein U9P50_01035 [Patescibacteria group bacterium]|nr:hypothetical protein [Patescibacteria group bacterium]